MKGSPGPYMNEDGDIWIPRTVPWKDARAVASQAIQESDFVLRYIGKENATLFGFARGCDCEEECRLTDTEADDFDPAIEDACIVPAWHFRQDDPYDLQPRMPS